MTTARCCLLACLFGLLAILPVAHAQGKGPRYAEGVVLVGYQPGTPEAARASARRSVAAVRAKALSRLAVDAEKVELPPGKSVPAAIKALLRHPSVRVAEPDYILTKVATANDPFYTGSSLWGMYGDATSPANPFGSQAGEAWAAGHVGSSTVYVGVIDEGIQVTHPDLAANVWVNPFEIPGNGRDDDGNGYVDDINGWDFFHNDASVYDAGEDSHGTHVAGTIGGIGGNGEGVAGVNWQVKMISAKFLGPSGGQTSAAIAAIDYFNDLKTRHGLNIVATSNSWGGGGFSQLLLDAINRGGDRGILFVTAAGNNSANIDGGAFYPASYECTTPARNWDCLISVGSITSSGALSSFSNYGAVSVDIGAPGSEIWSTVPVNAYATNSGTSMATPHVSGAVALCGSISPSLAARDRRFALLNSAAPTPSLAGITVTGGRLDIGALVSACRPASAPVGGAPQSLAATASSPTTIDLTWVDGSSGKTYYELQRGDSACRGFATIATLPASATTYRVGGLSPSTTYCFQVRSANDYPSTSAWSNSASATTRAVPAPYQCAATTYEWIDTGSGQSLGLGDDAQAAVTMPFAWPFYGTPTDQIRIASNGFVRLDGGMATAYDNASIPSASDPNGFIAPFWDDLNPGAGGAVRVATAGTQPSRRYVVSWEGVPHFNLSGSTLSFQLVFEEATGQVVMNYGDVIAGSASYDGGASATVGIEDPTGGYGTLLSYNRASLTGGTSYRCAPQSASQPPAAPSALTAVAASPTRVDLNWSNVSGETAYAIERATGTGSFLWLANVSADVTTFTDTGVAEQTGYSYRVRAQNSAGWSGYSNAAAVTTPGIVPAVPMGVGASVSGTTVTVTWTDASTNETGFDIGQETYNSKTKTWSAIAMVGTAAANATSYVRSPGAGTYRYRVRAVNKSVSSSFSGASPPVTVASGRK